MEPNRSAVSIFSLLRFLSTAILSTSAFTASAQAEFVLSAYAGAIDTMDADLTGGGSIEVKPWSNHILFGLSYTFR